MAVFIIPGLLRKKDFYKPLRERVVKAGFSVSVIDLGYNTENLDTTSYIVWQYLKDTLEKDHIIAHSYGGIILKYLLFKHPEVKEQLKTIIFVAVPHGGAWSALLLSLLPAARECLPTSKHFADLVNVSLPENTVNFIAEKEFKIWPRRSALLKNFIDIVIPKTNHDSIMQSEDFANKAIGFLKSNFVGLSS